MCLLKVDTYLASHRGQPGWLKSEELYFTIPSTFGFWNANGIIVWDSRIKTEPVDRTEITINDMVGGTTADAENHER